MAEDGALYALGFSPEVTPDGGYRGSTRRIDLPGTRRSPLVQLRSPSKY